MTQSITEIIEEALKYFAWVDSSGIHGKEKYKAYSDFLEQSLLKIRSEAKEEGRREVLGEVEEIVEEEKQFRIKHCSGNWAEGAVDALVKIGSSLKESIK